MKRWIAGQLLLALAVTLSSGQQLRPSAATPPVGTPAAVRVQQVFTVALLKSLDSKKLKKGDKVEAQVMAAQATKDGIPLVRGSEVIGHISEATARASGNGDSNLGVVFDKLKVQGRTKTDVRLVILAVAPNPALIAGDRGGHVDYTDITDFPVYGTVPSQRGKAVPTLTEQSRGVMGFKDLQLGPDGVLTSSEKEVKLDAGTEMLLGVEKP